MLTTGIMGVGSWCNMFVERFSVLKVASAFRSSSTGEGVDSGWYKLSIPSSLGIEDVSMDNGIDLDRLYEVSCACSS